MQKRPSSVIISYFFFFILDETPDLFRAHLMAESCGEERAVELELQQEQTAERSSSDTPEHQPHCDCNRKHRDTWGELWLCPNVSRKMNSVSQTSCSISCINMEHQSLQLRFTAPENATERDDDKHPPQSNTVVSNPVCLCDQESCVVHLSLRKHHHRCLPRCSYWSTLLQRNLSTALQQRRWANSAPCWFGALCLTNEMSGNVRDVDQSSGDAKRLPCLHLFTSVHFYHHLHADISQDTLKAGEMIMELQPLKIGSKYSVCTWWRFTGRIKVNFLVDLFFCSIIRINSLKFIYSDF